MRKHFGLAIWDFGLGQGFRLRQSHNATRWREPTLRGRYEGQEASGGRRTKRVFLRNEPELPTRKYERMLQGGRGLGCANGFFNSGSFGEKWGKDGRMDLTFNVKRSTFNAQGKGETANDRDPS